MKILLPFPDFCMGCTQSQMCAPTEKIIRDRKKEEGRKEESRRKERTREE